MTTLLQTIRTEPSTFWPGDMVVVIQNDLVARLQNKLITPHTHKFHMAIIAEYSPLEGDFIIFESTPGSGRGGVSIARLSWYNGMEVQIYRPTNSNHVDGEVAVWNSTKDGRKHYNFLICAEIGLRVISYCLTHFKPIPYTKFPSASNKTVICTMFANDAWKNTIPVFDQRYLPMPANFEQQLVDGKVKLVGEWKGDKSHGKYRNGYKPKQGGKK